MTIELPGLNKADSYKSSQGGLSGGFVKNDAAGLLLLDQAGPPTDAAQWQHIETKVISTPVTSTTFSGLDGDADEIYKLIWVQQFEGTGSAPGHYLQPNGIGVVFGDGISVSRKIRHPGASNQVQVLNANNGLRLFHQTLSAGTPTNPQSWRSVLYLHAKTGKPRQFINHFTFLSAATGAPWYQPRVTSEHVGGWWFDTTTNITSLSLWSFGPNIRGTFSLYSVNI